MPVVLREAKIGLVVKPPRTAMYACNGCLVCWDNLYEVSRKDPKNRSVWLNPHPVRMNISGGRPVSASAGRWAITVADATLGRIQIDEDAVWLLPTDPKPDDGVRVVRLGGPSSGEPKRRSGPDTEYEFAFDDDEITLEDEPTQAQILADIFLEIYSASGTKIWTEKEIDEILHRPENVERLHTTQDPMMIFRFYRSRLQKKNFIKRT